MVELPKSLSLHRLLKLLKSEKDSHATLNLFFSATLRPGYSHNAAVFLHVLRRVATAPSLLLPHIPGIVDIIRSQSCQCTEDMPLTALKAYAKNSMPQEALHLFQQIFRCSPGVRSFNALLNAFAESNQWDYVEKFFAYFETVGVEPNLETYNVLMKGLLDWSWGVGLRPDRFTYGTLINDKFYYF